MFGFNLILQDDTVVQGTIYYNHSCYAHEPICDMWHSVGDMLQELDDAVKEFRIIGPVVPTQTLLETLEQDYQRKVAELDKARRELDRFHKASKHDIEQLQGDPIEFIKKMEAA